jgi:hypothetical protein
MLTTSFLCSIRGSGYCNKARERNKKYPERKEEIKLSLFAEDIIVHAEILIRSTQKVLQLKCKFSST